jgi:hypothetical protein
MTSTWFLPQKKILIRCPYLRDKQKYQFFARDMVSFPVNITICSGENFPQGITLKFIDETSIVHLKKTGIEDCGSVHPLPHTPSWCSA